MSTFETSRGTAICGQANYEVSKASPKNKGQELSFTEDRKWEELFLTKVHWRKVRVWK